MKTIGSFAALLVISVRLTGGDGQGEGEDPEVAGPPLLVTAVAQQQEDRLVSGAGHCHLGRKCLISNPVVLASA